MSKINFKNDLCKYIGLWQENAYGEIVSYGTISWFEIGFTGDFLLVEGSLEGKAVFLIDDQEKNPEKSEKGFTFSVNDGRHILRIKIYADGHLSLRNLAVNENQSFFRVPDKPYIQFIGDSITHAYPGFASVAAETIGIDYSVVSHCGMSLVDGWGWYQMPECMNVRMGMETRYFQLESPTETDNYTQNDFMYCRAPDIISIFLGTNDYLDSEANKNAGNVQIFAEHYLNFVLKIREVFPETKILIMKALSDKFCRNEGIQTAFDTISNKISNVQLIPSDTWQIEISDDGTHPTELGYSQIAKELTAYLKALLK